MSAHLPSPGAALAARPRTRQPSGLAGDVTVIKLGSSVLPDDAALAAAVHEIYRHIRRGARVVAVVSALGATTDALTARAGQLLDGPAGGVDGAASRVGAEALAALLATGEATSVALLGLALDRAGIPATLFDAERAGLATEGPILEARPISLDRAAVLAALAERPVAVLPGFVGRDRVGRTTLLGRGGSDLTALFVAHELGAARCLLVKDVSGIYEADPKKRPDARRFETLTFEEADRLLGLGEAGRGHVGIVQPKAVRFALERRRSFAVVALGDDGGTLVGATATRLQHPAQTPAPLRVALLGLGTVGLGVYRRLAADPQRFEVVGVAVRDRDKHRADGVPLALLDHDAAAVAALPCDVVVELLGGLEPAGAIVAAALEAGRHVVSANKALIAERGEELGRLARRHHARLSFAAAVGGALPVLERLAALPRGQVATIECVLNGTTNYILDRLAAGDGFAAALEAAQRAGFAEADPTLDLDGTDAAQKLSILSRIHQPRPLTVAAIARRGLDPSIAALVTHARDRGEVVRLLASCRLRDGAWVGEVAPVLLASSHPLARVEAEDNGVVVTLVDGSCVEIHGKGAGRWPTTEAVLGDLAELALSTMQAPDGGAPIAVAS